MAFNWTCPYCQTVTTINDDNFHVGTDTLEIKNPSGRKHLRNEWIVCPNDDCEEISLSVILFEFGYIKQRWQTGEVIDQWNLLPGSYAKSFPDYIPEPLRKDYKEAASILDRSPKASATLSRRCLQGIIRDFWKVSKGRLVDEINAIEEKVDPLTWQSIDAVRQVGNIGAHMEKDINLIIDVEPNEAYLLIELIELLFVEWYVHRHEREKKLNAIVEVAKQKKDDKKK